MVLSAIVSNELPVFLAFVKIRWTQSEDVVDVSQRTCRETCDGVRKTLVEFDLTFNDCMAEVGNRDFCSSHRDHCNDECRYLECKTIVHPMQACITEYVCSSRNMNIGLRFSSKCIQLNCTERIGGKMDAPANSTILRGFARAATETTEDSTRKPAGNQGNFANGFSVQAT